MVPEVRSRHPDTSNAFDKQPGLRDVRCGSNRFNQAGKTPKYRCRMFASHKIT